MAPVKFTLTFSFTDKLQLFQNTKAIGGQLSPQRRATGIVSDPSLPLWECEPGGLSNCGEETQQDFCSIRPGPCYHHSY